MARNNPFGYNQYTGRKPSTFGPQSRGFGLTIDSQALRRMAVQFGNERRRADPALIDANTRLAYWAQLHMLEVLQERVIAGGRPQKFGQVKLRKPQGALEKALVNEKNRVVTVAGFGVGNPDWLDSTEARPYWRQVEEGAKRERLVEGLFGLPPLAGGRAREPLQGPLPGANSAVKFAEFYTGRRAKFSIRVGPETGYAFLKEGRRRAMAEYRRTALGIYKDSFRAFRLDFMARFQAREGFQPGRFSDLFISG